MNCTDSQSAPSCIAPAQNSAEVASSWCGGTCSMQKTASLDLGASAHLLMRPPARPASARSSSGHYTPALATASVNEALLFT